MKFEKGKQKTGGKKKGSKNKSTLLLQAVGEITPEEKTTLFRKVYAAAIKLIEKQNPTIINTLLNKMFPNAEPIKNDNSDIEIPVNVNELSDEQTQELYDKIVKRKC